MKFNNQSAIMVKLLVSGLFIFGLSACGNDAHVKTEASKNIFQGAATGVLTAGAAIEGVSYSATSGASGVTDAKGTFKFNYGDRIQFQLGKLTLGDVEGSTLISPIELAGSNARKRQNLLILLQSLDTDNDPENGITISESASSALDSSLNLQADPAEFVLSPVLTGAREAAGIPDDIRGADEANAYFLSRAVDLLGSHTWIHVDATHTDFFRAATDNSGAYLHGVTTADDACDLNRACGSRVIFTAGLEYGVATASMVDERGFKFSSKIELDTDAQGGLSHTSTDSRIRSSGDELIISNRIIVPREKEQAGLFDELFHISKPIDLSDENEVAQTEIMEVRYIKMENQPNNIVGAWAPDRDSIKTPTLLFFADGRYMSVDPTGSTWQEKQPDCAKPGVEMAKYTFDATSRTLKLSSFVYNTSGCAGLSDHTGSIGFDIAANGQSATLALPSREAVTLYRISD
ncbi:MAG: adhesin [Nitrosomonas sp.]|nr:adhesin [Nitrosomonas sp.]